MKTATTAAHQARRDPASGELSFGTKPTRFLRVSNILPAILWTEQAVFWAFIRQTT